MLKIWCPRCGGKGTVKGFIFSKTCPRCNGRRTVSADTITDEELKGLSIAEISAVMQSVPWRFTKGRDA